MAAAASAAATDTEKRRSLTISCLCGAARQVVVALQPEPGGAQWPTTVTLCHCDTCRHLTGVLCTSYVSISPQPAPPPSLAGLVEYHSMSPVSSSSSSSSQRYYFCATCGCHILRRRRSRAPASSVSGGVALGAGVTVEWDWEVATGVIIESPPPLQVEEEGQRQHALWNHVHVQETKDGGLTAWLTPTTTPEQEGAKHPPPPPPSPASSGRHENMGLLPASCHCGTVSFLISRPDPSISTLPHSNFPDLMLPYCRTSSSVISNHADEKWWIRGGTGGAKSRYLAGTCACRSCRLGSGFEIQTWAFVPRANILFGIPSTAGGGRTELKPLDFATLPRGVLQSYESSVGVIREFCGRCGATIFWHDKWRPDLIDVSVGLLRAPEGARAETWLEWWTDRVSFAEEAGNERAGSVMNWATTLIAYLEDGLKKRQEPCEDEDSLWAQTQRSC